MKHQNTCLQFLDEISYLLKNDVYCNIYTQPYSASGILNAKQDFHLSEIVNFELN